jgi:hypothetical protein
MSPVVLLTDAFTCHLDYRTQLQRTGFDVEMMQIAERHRERSEIGNRTTMLAVTMRDGVSLGAIVPSPVPSRSNTRTS